MNNQQIIGSTLEVTPRQFIDDLKAKLQPGEPLILKGIGRVDGDGWKDTTKVGQVIFVWNYELPKPYKEGQFTRVGYEDSAWTASIAQYDFTQATNLAELLLYIGRLPAHVRCPT